MMNSTCRLLRSALFAAFLLTRVAMSQGAAASEPIDFIKARALMERQRAGKTLSADEAAYLERARAARRGGGRSERMQGKRGGVQRPAPERLIPITDFGGDQRYEGEDGGLYGGGKNTPPDAVRKAAEQQLALIRPLDAKGKPDPNGTIGFISISMSNATQEFSHFKSIADRSESKSRHVTIVDCAQGGQAMAEWVSPDAHTWAVTKQRLAAAKLAPEQVQVAWIKVANKSPSGSFQDHARKLEADTLAVLHNAKRLFPNLRIAYFSGRTYGAYGKGGLNPEPYAYESSFVPRWLIQRQTSGDAALELDKAPLLLWGPYLWAEGTKGRMVDGLVWERSDFREDGVHPSDSGRQKVADLLMKFFTTDPLARTWFARKP